MPEHYIDPDWRNAVRHLALFYPASGPDYVEPLEVFQNDIDRFVFCDLRYSSNTRMLPAILPPENVELLSTVREGAVRARLETRTDSRGRSYRFLLPSKRIDTYQRIDGSQFSVVCRRGFSQIALVEEFKERSIGVFMHRGDSVGEGGSNVWFLANRRMRYKPISNLFDKLAPRLANKALVISDGSNTVIPALVYFHSSRIDGSEAFQYHQTKTQYFDFGGFRWECVGWLKRRYGPTLVWGLTRLEA